MNKKLILIIFLGIFLFNIINVNASLIDGLLRYYTLNESSGDAIELVSGYNGTVTGATQGVAGKLGTAYSFDGNDKVSAVDTGLPSGSADSSICAWFNTTYSGALYSTIAGWGSYNGTGNMRELAVTNNHKLAFSNYGQVLEGNTLVNNGTLFFGCFTTDGTNASVYVNGILENYSSKTINTQLSGTFKIGSIASTDAEYFTGNIDEIAVWDRALSQVEITQLYNNGAGRSIIGGTTISISLLSPLNDSISSNNQLNFNASLNISGDNEYGYYWKNATYYVWDNADSLFNETTISASGNNSIISQLISNFELGSYKWTVKAYYGNASYSNYASYNFNYTFNIGVSLNSIIYTNNTWETKLETFIANFSILEGSEISLVQLVYNGTNYTINNLSQDGNNIIIYKRINIPLNINSTANQTNEFYFRFTYGGSQTQETENYEQNSSFISLSYIGSGSMTKSLNFTMYDETSGEVITTNTTFQTTFIYWLGDGNITKNFSYSQILGENKTFIFYIYPYNNSNNFNVNMDLYFEATNYYSNNYYLRNSTLTNITSNISLYLLNQSIGTKFYGSVLQGVSQFPDAIITITKYFVGENVYKTIGIKNTDNRGKFTAYLEQDKNYQYSIVKDGILSKYINKTSTCSSSPCEFTLQISGEQGNIWKGYDDYFANGTVSNLTYNPNTKIVTYTFLDITGLAHYFRLVVIKPNMNTTEGQTICNTTVYSSSGTITCNMTGYDGDFIAKGYISRSPEKLDQIIGITINSLIDSLGIYGALFCFAIILTLVFAGAVVSRGNPAVILISFGLSILVLKFMTILPFSWITVSVIELGVLYLTKLTKT